MYEKTRTREHEDSRDRVAHSTESLAHSSHHNKRYDVIGMVMLAVVVGVLASCTESARGALDESSERADTLQISKWHLPSALSFCTESVPLNDPEVRERAEREFYLNLQTPGQVMLYLKRSARWFPMYERIMKAEKVPLDLRYLSIAESALYMSRSAKDAVGLWQFIPETARAMGLIVTDKVDERRHPEKSTLAAIKYLRQGRDAGGSWTNAAAGYNMGHENFAENQRYQGVGNFYDLFLNEETSRYVLRIAVIKHIIEHAHEYGIVVPEAERYAPAALQRITERAAISDLAGWAKEHGSNYKEVKLNNPWILGRTLPAPDAEKPWVIAIAAN